MLNHSKYFLPADLCFLPLPVLAISPVTQQEIGAATYDSNRKCLACKTGVFGGNRVMQFIGIDHHLSRHFGSYELRGLGRVRLSPTLWIPGFLVPQSKMAAKWAFFISPVLRNGIFFVAGQQPRSQGLLAPAKRPWEQGWQASLFPLLGSTSPWERGCCLTNRILQLIDRPTLKNFERPTVNKKKSAPATESPYSGLILASPRKKLLFANGSRHLY